MKISKIALGAAALALSGPALAGEVDSFGLYARVEGGVSIPEKMNQDLEYNPALTFAPPPPSRRTVDAGAGYAAGGAVGFRYENGVRTELEYRYQSSDVDAVAFDAGAPAFAPEASLAAHLLMSNFAYEIRNDSPFTPFVGGGVGAAWVSSPLGAGAASETDLTYAWQARAGVALAVGETMRLAAEYVYVRTGKLTYGPDAFEPAGPFAPRISGDEFAASTALVSLEKSF